MPPRGNFAERLLSRRRIDPETGCWMWTGSKTSAGYGQLRNGKGRKVYAHRMSAKVFGGLDIDGLLVLHSCDTPACFNPAHLRTGTKLDNARDALERGQAATGTRCGMAKLNEESVAAIRRELADGGTLRGVAARYGVTGTTVYAIKAGWTWRGVGLPRGEGTERDVLDAWDAGADAGVRGVGRGDA